MTDPPNRRPLNWVLRWALMLALGAALAVLGGHGARADDDGPIVPMPDFSLCLWPGDADEDGLSNCAETQVYGSDPLNRDTDGDGIGDGVEVHSPGTDPTVADPDTDGDGWPDAYEAWMNSFNPDGSCFADPNDPDSDDDGIPDGQDRLSYTHPGTKGGCAWSDSDNDGLVNDKEPQFGTDPWNPDTDGDGIGDGHEIAFGSDPLDPTAEDLDADGLLDAEEVDFWGTDPANPDTDGDGLLDGAEVNTWFTGPALSDTDGDHYNDGLEVKFGTDPRDPLSHPIIVLGD